MHRTHAAVVKLLIHAVVPPASGVVPQAERSNRNQRSNCNQRGVQVQGQPGLRRVDQVLGFPRGCPRPEVAPHHRPPQQPHQPPALALTAAVSERVFNTGIFIS